MTHLSKVKTDRKPPRHVVLKPSAFEPNWVGCPKGDVAVGLRLLSVSETAHCRLEAEREATGVYEAHQTWVRPMLDVLVENYNEILLCNAMARACCDPNDVTRPYFDIPEITVRMALTSEGLRKLWDEYIVLSVGTGCLTNPATDEDLAILGRALKSGTANVLDVEGRKLCTYLLEKLAVALPDRPETDDEDEDAITVDDESTYIARTE